MMAAKAIAITAVPEPKPNKNRHISERRHRACEVPLPAAGVEHPQRRRREPLVTDDVDEPPEPQRVEDLVRRMVERQVAAGAQLPAHSVTAVPEVEGLLDLEPLGVGHDAYVTP